MSVNNNNRKITQLPKITTSGMTDDDIFVFVNSGATSQGTLGDIASYFATNTDTFSTGGTYNQTGSTITIDNNQGGSFDITGITTSINGDNGITIQDGDTVELGGRLKSGLTTIQGFSGGTSILQLGDSSNRIGTLFGFGNFISFTAGDVADDTATLTLLTAQAGIITGKNGYVEIGTNDATLGQSTKFRVDHGITTLTDTVPNSAGIQYGADYSDNYTDLSLITKGDVKTGNILYVDNVNGNDSTGEKGSLVNKYATISAAESGATSGDTIVVMTMQNEETNLGKNQITYHFLPGTGIKNTTTTGRIFNDNGKTDSGANPLFFKITGWGDFTSRTDQSALWGGTLYLYEGSSAEFEFNSSTILNLDGSKADSGYHFWAQAEYINGAGAGKLATLKGRVSRDVIGGHYFLGAHSAIANIDVGGNVDVSAIFVGAQGCKLVDVNVDQKVTLGYSTTQSFKFFLNVDGVPFFTGNINTIEGTNTINIGAKMVEWQNDGTNQNGIWGIFKIYEYYDNTNTHIRNNVNINIDEILVKDGTQTVQRPFIVSSNMGNDTETVVKFNNCKITIEDGFPFTGIASSSQKDKYNIMFQDCSIDYQSTGFTSGYTIFDTSYVMPHFDNTRFKVSDTSYEIVGSTVDKEIAVYGGGLFTNGIVPDDTVNINTELAMSADTTNVFSELNNIKII